MKKLLLLSLTVFTLIAKSQTSVYHPFPDSGAVWSVTSNWGCFTFESYPRYYTIQMEGDTLIGGIQYKKLATPMVIFHSEGSCNMYGTWTEPGFYSGSIRQDTSLKTVFIVPPSDSVEQVLYDFNLQVGDTVKGYVGPGSLGDDIVLSVDSVLVGNSYRKRWLTNEMYQIYWIEGIGSTFGLLERSWGNAVCPPPPHLSCFSQNDLPLYPSTTTTCTFMQCNSTFSLIPNDTIAHNWIVVSNISGTPPFTYSWSWGDGTTDTSAFPSHTYDTAGYYTICVTVADNEGCTTSYCDSSTYLYKTDAEMVSVNVHDSSLPVGISAISSNERKLKLSPNPAKSVLNIQSPSKQVRLNDLSGKTLLTIKLNKGKADVDISNLDNGIYFLQTDNGQTQKLIIQH